MNETLVLVAVGLLLSLSAGVRITLPLLALNLLATHHAVTLPPALAWLGTSQSSLLLGIAFLAETLIHFVPVVGTGAKTVSTPLAFIAGTLAMSLPLAEENPLVKWTLAGAVGGGLATLMHVGVTGLRTASAPANLASGGLFGVIWNLGELLGATVLSLLATACLFAGWFFGALAIMAFAGVALVFALKTWRHFNRLRPV